MNGNIVIVGDFNIDWFNKNGFVQNICTETHSSHHLLDYIITRKDCNIILSDFLVSDLFPVIEHFTHRCNVYVLILFGNKLGK